MFKSYCDKNILKTSVLLSSSVFSQYELACKYGIIFQISIYIYIYIYLDAELNFVIPGVTIANQARP